MGTHPSAVNGGEWNPSQVALIRDGGTGNIEALNPVAALLHELDHEYKRLFPGVIVEPEPGRYATDEEIGDYAERFNDTSNPYHNLEEEGIMNVEQPYTIYVAPYKI